MFYLKGMTFFQNDLNTTKTPFSRVLWAFFPVKYNNKGCIPAEKINFCRDDLLIYLGKN